MSGGTSGRTVVGGARVVSGAEKKAFDRGGPVWPPRSNAADDRLGGALGGLCPPSQKPGVLGGSAAQPKFFEKNEKSKKRKTRNLLNMQSVSKRHYASCYRMLKAHLVVAALL